MTYSRFVRQARLRTSPGAETSAARPAAANPAVGVESSAALSIPTDRQQTPRTDRSLPALGQGVTVQS